MAGEESVSLGSSVVDLQALEDVAECPICTESEGAPKILPCNHTICLACISQMLEKSRAAPEAITQLCCPLCRQNVKIPVGGASGLPTNYTVVQLREVLKSVNTRTKDDGSATTCSSPCEICRGRTNVVAYCKDCSKHLCRTCAMSHTKKRVFAYHVIVHVNDATILCLVHNERYKYVCITCNRLLCIPCVSEDVCVDHDVQELMSIASAKEKSMKKVVDNLLRDIKQREEELLPVAWQLDHELEHTARQISGVKEHVDSVVSMVKAQELHLVDDLRDRHEQLLRVKQTLDVENKLERLHCLKDAAYAALRLGPEHVICALPNIRLKMAEIKEDKKVVEQATQLLAQRVKFHKNTLHDLGALIPDTLMEAAGGDAYAEEDLAVTGSAEKVAYRARPTRAYSYTKRLRAGGVPAAYSESPTPWWRVKDLVSAWDVAVLQRGRIVLTDDNMVKLYGAGQLKPDHTRRLQEPRGICYYAKGQEILVVDTKDCSVYVLDERDLRVKECISLARVVRPFGIATLNNGNIVVCDYQRNEISIHGRNGKCIRYWGKRGIANTHFAYPCYVLVDKLNHILVADNCNHLIKIFDQHGRFVGRLADAPWLAGPTGMCEDSLGNILVSSGTVDASKQTVTVWEPDNTHKITLLERTPDYVETSGQLTSVDMCGQVLAILSSRSVELFKWRL